MPRPSGPRRPRPLLAALLAASIAAGCVPVGDRPADEDGEAAPLEPAFEPQATAPAAAATEPSTPPSTQSPDSPPAAATSPPATTGPATSAPASPPPASEAPSPDPTAASSPRGSSGAADAPADRTDRIGGSPGWADLADGRLSLADDVLALEVAFAEPAPSTAPDDHTFNVASFHDLDGDGVIDVEVWANLGPGGWGTATFDAQGARYADEDQADARVVDGRLVVTFPWAELRRAPAWRWSLASEYGTTAELGSRLAARDDLPDDDQPIGMRTSAG